MTKAIYALSGDPITFGHIDIIKRASKSFDEVVVVLGINPEKKYSFNLKERTQMVKKAISNIPNINVSSFKGLLVNYAYEQNVDVIVKGVRNSADFNYENILHKIGQSQKSGIDTHILFANPKLEHISSSAVKGIQKEQGLIQNYVPLHVKQALEERISNQYILGVTGEQASGKSYLCDQIKQLEKSKNFEIHNIELDHIGHNILNNLKEPRYIQVRNDIANYFGNHVQKDDGSIDRKVLGEIVFNDSEKLNKLNEFMRTPLQVRLRRELYGKKGLILLNAALIAESNRSYLCNNNVLIITADKKIQKERLKGRNLNDSQIERRLSTQYDFNKKVETMENIIKENNHGHIWTYNNSNELDKNQLSNTIDKISTYLGVNKK